MDGSGLCLPCGTESVLKNQSLEFSNSSNKVELTSLPSDETLTSSSKPNEFESSISSPGKDLPTHLYSDESLSYDTNNTNGDSSTTNNTNGDSSTIQTNEKPTATRPVNTVSESHTNTKSSAEKGKEDKECVIDKEKEKIAELERKEEQKKSKEELERKEEEERKLQEELERKEESNRLNCT
jgi:hypothetical protein